VDLSTAILSLSENGDLQRITDKWLTSGGSSASSQADDLEADRLHVRSFAALFLICGVACLLALAVHASVLYRQYLRHVAESADPAAGSSPLSHSHRSRLRSFLSFANHREVEFRKSPKDAAAGGSNSRVSFTSSNSTNTGMSR
jgi:glutamate receptor, ionotropic, plant